MLGNRRSLLLLQRRRWWQRRLPSLHPLHRPASPALACPCLLELYDVGVYQLPVVQDLTLHVFGDLGEWGHAGMWGAAMSAPAQRGRCARQQEPGTDPLC